jgi:uncharacterized protein (DUF305 family)
VPAATNGPRARPGRRLPAVGLALVLLVPSPVVLAGCTRSAAVPVVASGPVEPVDVSSVSVRHAPADVVFAQAVLSRQQQAAELARLAEDRAGSRAVRGLARDVAREREADIEVLTALLTAWQAELPGAMEGQASTAPTLPAPTAGLVAPDVVASLTAADGDAFDAGFLAAMAAHHRAVGQLARAELADGTNPQALELAERLLQREEQEGERATRLGG